MHMLLLQDWLQETLAVRYPQAKAVAILLSCLTELDRSCSYVEPAINLHLHADLDLLLTPIVLRANDQHFPCIHSSLIAVKTVSDAAVRLCRCLTRRSIRNPCLRS